MIKGNYNRPGEPTEDNRDDIFNKSEDTENSRFDSTQGLLSTVQSKSADRAEDSTTSDDAPITKEDLELIISDLSALGYRVEHIEEQNMNRLPIPLPTPSDGLEEVKVKITQIINYINIGIR